MSEAFILQNLNTFIQSAESIIFKIENPKQIESLMKSKDHESFLKNLWAICTKNKEAMKFINSFFLSEEWKTGEKKDQVKKFHSIISTFLQDHLKNFQIDGLIPFLFLIQYYTLKITDEIQGDIDTYTNLFIKFLKELKGEFIIEGETEKKITKTLVFKNQNDEEIPFSFYITVIDSEPLDLDFLEDSEKKTEEEKKAFKQKQIFLSLLRQKKQENIQAENAQTFLASFFQLAETFLNSSYLPKTKDFDSFLNQISEGILKGDALEFNFSSFLALDIFELGKNLSFFNSLEKDVEKLKSAYVQSFCLNQDYENQNKIQRKINRKIFILINSKEENEKEIQSLCEKILADILNSLKEINKEETSIIQKSELIFLPKEIIQKAFQPYDQLIDQYKQTLSSSFSLADTNLKTSSKGFLESIQMPKEVNQKELLDLGWDSIKKEFQNKDGETLSIAFYISKKNEDKKVFFELTHPVPFSVYGDLSEYRNYIYETESIKEQLDRVRIVQEIIEKKKILTFLINFYRLKGYEEIKIDLDIKDKSTYSDIIDIREKEALEDEKKRLASVFQIEKKEEIEKVYKALVQTYMRFEWEILSQSNQLGEKNFFEEQTKDGFRLAIIKKIESKDKILLQNFFKLAQI